MTDPDRLRELARDNRVVHLLNLELLEILDRLSAAEKARDAWQEAFKAAYERAIRQVERVRINARGDAYDAHNQAVEICLTAIRALSPLTALPQTTQHEKHETTGNED